MQCHSIAIPYQYSCGIQTVPTLEETEFYCVSSYVPVNKKYAGIGLG